MKTLEINTYVMDVYKAKGFLSFNSDPIYRSGVAMYGEGEYTVGFDDNAYGIMIDIHEPDYGYAVPKVEHYKRLYQLANSNFDNISLCMECYHETASKAKGKCECTK